MQNQHIESLLINDYFRDPTNYVAAILLGRSSKRELRSLYTNTTSQGYDNSWIENPKDEVEFWTKLLTQLKGQSAEVDVELEMLVATVGDTLRSLDHRHNLFVPNVDKLFYRFDSSKPYRFGQTLRVKWSLKENNLNIFGSASSQNSESYKKTLGEYEYPMWENNWLMAHLNQGGRD